MDKIKTLMLDKIKEEILEELRNEYEIYNKGLMKLEFNSDTSSAEYFVVRQQ